MCNNMPRCSVIYVIVTVLRNGNVIGLKLAPHIVLYLEVLVQHKVIYMKVKELLHNYILGKTVTSV